MRHRFAVLLGLLCLLPATARADRHKWDAAAGATASSGGSTLYGFHVSTAFTIKPKRLMLVADFNHLREGDEDLDRDIYLLGFRYQYGSTYESKVLPFAHVMLGEVHSQLGSARRTIDFAAVLGVGLDTLITDDGRLGLRLQVDALRTWADRDAKSFVRVTGGVVFRLDSHHEPGEKH